MEYMIDITLTEPAPVTDPIAYFTIPKEAYPEWSLDHIARSNGLEASDDFDVFLAREILPSMTQADLAKRTVEAREITKFEPTDISHYGSASAPVIHATAEAIYNNRSHPVARKVAAFLKTTMRNNWLNTLTLTRYNPERVDKAIHDIGMPTEYSMEADIVGEDQFIEQGDSKALKAVLGTDDVGKINEVYQGINDTNMYIWRWNNKPSNVEDRVVRLVADSDRADLDCYRHPEYSYSSLGLVVRKAQRQK